MSTFNFVQVQGLYCHLHNNYSEAVMKMKLAMNFLVMFIQISIKRKKNTSKNENLRHKDIK